MKTILWLAASVIFLFHETGFSQGLSIQASQSTICAGSSVTLYAVGGAAPFSWQPGGSTNQSLTVSPAATTTYTVTSGANSVSYTVNVCENSRCKSVGLLNPLLLNTGSNGLNAIRAVGQADANWMMSNSLNGTYTSTIVSSNTNIPGNYSRTIWPNAQWVGPNATLRSPGSGRYFFRVQFTLTAEEANSLVLDMNFMADNTVIGVSVNNVLVPNSGTPGGTNYGFQSPNAASVNMQGHWVEGLNTISVEINDEGGYVGFVGQLNPAVSIPQPPVICNPVYVTEDTLQLCKGDSIQLQAQDAVTYSWLPVTGLSNPSISNPKASPSANTTYIVKGTDANGLVSYDSIIVFVNDIVHFELGTGDTVECSDLPIVLNLSLLDGSVLWQDGSTNPVYTVSDTGTYAVKVTNQCGSVSDTIKITCNPVYVIVDTLQLCKGDSVQLLAGNAVSYSWSPITGLSNPTIANPKASPSVQTTYVVRGIDAIGHESYDSVVVLVHAIPHVDLGSHDIIRCTEQPIVLDVSLQGTTVLWQDGSTNPKYIVPGIGTYYVQLTNQCGSASDTLKVLPCCETINVPNLFTPNDDRHNDYFYIGCLGSGGWKLQVFNCWGGMVYSNSDYQNNWDGKDLSDGVYYYELWKNNKGDYKGWVQIIR